MNHARAVSPLLVLLAGCTVGRAPLYVLVTPARANGEPVPLEVSLGTPNSGDCRVLSKGAFLEVGGTKLRTTYPGSGRGVRMGKYGIPSPSGCSGAKFAGSLPARDGDVRVRLVDGGRVVVDGVYPGLLSVRRLELRAPSDGRLRNGKPASIAWLPASDDLLNYDASRRRHRIAVGLRARADPMGPAPLETETVLVDGSRVDFTSTFIASSGKSEPVSLYLDVAAVKLRAKSCKGEYACDGNVWGQFTPGRDGLPHVDAMLEP